MEAVQEVLSCPELLEVILEKVGVSDLVNCSLVNWSWNKEAVKILNQKAMVYLNLDNISPYMKGIREGGRCHEQIAVLCVGPKVHDDGIIVRRHAATLEQFQDLRSGVELFGGSPIKKFIVKLQFGNGSSPTPEEWQPIFKAAKNVEFLGIHFELENGFAAASVLSCFPEDISFDCLKALRLRFDSENEDEQRNVITKLVGISQNLEDLAGTDDIVGVFLDEMGKSPGRLEKIVKIFTCPEDLAPAVLMRAEFPNLKTLKLSIYSRICDNVVPILEKYKDTLEELDLIFLCGLGGEVMFPKSMGKLKEIYLHFFCPGDTDEFSNRYPIPVFPEHDSEAGNADGRVFYPNLKKFVIDGHRQRGVLNMYLAMIFPGYFCGIMNLLRRELNSWNRSKFSSVRSLDFSSQCEDWGAIKDDEKTLLRLMHYFPNADFGSAQWHAFSEKSDGSDSDDTE